MFSEEEDFEMFKDSVLCRKVKSFKTRANPLEELDDGEFYSRYRFDKTTVRFLVENLDIQDPITNRGLPISPDLQVLVTLHFFGRNVHQSDVGALHGMVQSTVGKIIKNIAKRIASLLPHFIQFPSSPAELNDMKSGFYNIARFPKVIGAIDCTHVQIKRPARIVGPIMAGHYINRKGYYSLNVQIVTDHKCRIIDIVARSRGSLHDSNI
ncbi:putative nuclease HARBI1 [Eupeodes corollae]|uniref:putative nuclease HARBI1 n=1 Tax=Eupeodes corollae TaxID=290404 RepID=UPI00248FA455|nr:putative nuclease HARBI1 [Eupeodes corollae]